MKKIRSWMALSLALLLMLSVVTAAAGPYDPPEKRDVIAKNGVVAAAHPLAAQAGLAVLKKGGNAFDAAIATSFMLNVVEPNASGMGGGGFAVIYTAKDKKTYFIDYREMARTGGSKIWRQPSVFMPAAYQANCAAWKCCIKSSPR